MQPRPDLNALFLPQSVAVIGASRSPEKLGRIVLENLVQAGFKGKIYPVNRHGGTLLGLPVLRKPEEIPASERPLDLAVVCLPAKDCAACLEELGRIGTRAAVIIGGGFRETGAEGLVFEDAVTQAAKKYGMALLGPNSLGLVSLTAGVNVTFASGRPLPGGIGFFSQSGALCTAIFDWAKDRNIGFSSFLSLGNKALLDESDILPYLADDPNTKVILGYLESVENGPRFLENAHLATRKKPVILLKAGRTPAGERAASSHTGALAGADLAYDAAFRQTGIIRVSRTEELFGLAQAFATQPLPKGPGVAVVTNAGGPGIITMDAVETAKLTPARFNGETLAKLAETLPPYASFFNPVDTMADAAPERIAESVRLVLNDPVVHSLIFVCVPTAHTPLAEIARRVVEECRGAEKPVFACLMGGSGVAEADAVFRDAGIPRYSFPEQAVEAAAAMYRQSLWKESPLPVEVGYRHDTHRAAKVIAEAVRAGLAELVEFQAQEILKAYELPLLEAKLARTSDEAISIAKQLGGQVALKIASPQILHKTDVDGVRLGVEGAENIRRTFLDITERVSRRNKSAYIAGCLVQAMAPRNSREVIIGFKRDRRFGPMLVFGLGGIHTEAFKDISCRLAPLSLDDAHDMIREIKAFPVLAGMRGRHAVNFTALEDILIIMSRLALDFPEIEEAELNPVLVNEHSALVGDIRVLLSREARDGRFALPASEEAGSDS